MNKMTTLHFASPFAFSMPAPLPPPATAGRGTTEPRKVTQDAPATGSGRNDTLSALLDTDHASIEANAVSAIGTEGFEASAFDTALKRYLEQGPQSGSGTTGPEDEPEDDEDHA